MSIIFIDKINHNDNVINVCSAKNGNCILINNYMDILDFSKIFLTHHAQGSV